MRGTSMFTVAILLSLIGPSAATAQRVNPVQLDKQAESLQSDYLRGLDDLAVSYDEAGFPDKAKEVLRKRLQVSDDDEARKRLEELKSRDFENHRTEVTVDSSAGWVDTGVVVFSGQPVRIEASGRYRLIYNQEVGVEGVPLPEDAKDIPIGALTAVVYNPTGPKKKPLTSDARLVGARTQFDPEFDGRLYLRLNVPEGAKASGKIKATVSGRIRYQVEGR